jgi:hypothetical protein
MGEFNTGNEEPWVAEMTRARALPPMRSLLYPGGGRSLRRHSAPRAGDAAIQRLNHPGIMRPFRQAAAVFETRGVM